MLRPFIPKQKLAAVKARRASEFRKFKVRNQDACSQPLYAKPSSPLRYPVHGFRVRPLTPTLIPGLGLFAKERNTYQVSLTASSGILTTNVSDEDSMLTGSRTRLTGSGTASLTLESRSLTLLNFLLAGVFYTSSFYHVNTGDLVFFHFEEHEVVFPVPIREQRVPILWDMGTDINSQVTITIKTFMRYQKLNLLLESIRRFYPQIPVIIADDSFRPETVSGDNIEQHIMPPGRGWFAGRNLAVSQVETKYFLWVDDDFLFTQRTKIEKFVEVMEANPELDVVGGSVQGHRFFFSILYQEGAEFDGGCMKLDFERTFQSLPGFPRCSLVNGVVNFFLARTDAIQRAGFDPQLRRIGHPEVFMDGLGSLQVASCDDPSSMFIGHQPHSRNSNIYSRFRSKPDYNQNFRFPFYYFKHYLKCIKIK